MPPSNKEVLLQIGIDQAQLDTMLAGFGAKFAQALRTAIDKADLQGVLNNKVSHAATGAPPSSSSDSRGDLINKAVNLTSQIESQSAALARFRSSLEKGGVSLTDIEKRTQRFDGSLLQLSVRLGQLKTELEKENPDIQKLERSFTSLETRVDAFRRTLEKTDPSKIATGVQAQKVDSFFKNFAFSLGAIGYGLQNMGRHLENVSRIMYNLTEQSAQATEPLQRVMNLLSQEPDMTPEQLTAIGAQIRNLSDLPGANIEKISESLRVLLPLDQPIEKITSLIEGLTKAAARAGTGADGVARLAFQLRQFNDSRQLRELDVKAITEQGGRDVTRVLREAFGSTNAGVLQQAGPEKVIEALRVGLGKLPQPLATTTDHLNRLKNSLIQIGLIYGKVIEPALVSTERFLKTRLEPVLISISNRFDNLSTSQKNLVSAIVAGIPLMIGALGLLLSTLGTLAIGIAVITKLHEGWNISLFKVSGGLAGLSGKTRGALSAMTYFSQVIKTTFAPAILIVEGFINAFKRLTTFSLAAGLEFGKEGRNWGAVFQMFLRGGQYVTGLVAEGARFAGALELIGSALTGVFGGLLRILGLTTPIGLLINAVIAFITDFGRFRTTLVSGLGEIYTAIARLISKFSEASEKSQGIGHVFNFISGVVQVFISVLEVAAGAIGSVLELLLNISADVINSFTDIFTHPIAAMQAFGARGIITLKKFGYDAYLAVIEAGLRIFRAVPGMEKMADQLEVNIAGILEERNSLDKLTVSIDENTGKVTVQTQEQQKQNKELEKTKITQEEIAKGMKAMATEARLISESFNDVRKSALTAFNDINRGWADSVAKLRSGFAQFKSDLLVGFDRTELSRLINTDVNAAENQLGPSFQSTQDQKLKAAAGRAQADAQAIASSINTLFSQISTPETVPGGALSRVFPQFDTWFNNLKQSLAGINQLAASGVTDWDSYNKQLEDVSKTAADVAQVFSTVAGSLTPDELKLAQQGVQTIVDTTTKNIKELQGVSTGLAVQQAQIREETIKDLAAAQQEINLRKQALQSEQELIPLRERLLSLQEDLADQQAIRDRAVELNNVIEIENINNRILGITQSIADVEAEIATTQNYQRDELRRGEIANERDLKTTQNKLAAARELAQVLKQIGDENVKLIQSSAAGLDSLMSRLRQMGLSEEVIGRITSLEFIERVNAAVSLSSSQRALKTQGLRDQARQVAGGFNVPITLNDEEFTTLAKNGTNGVKPVLESLIKSLGDFSHSTFETILTNYTSLLTRALSETESAITATEETISVVEKKLLAPGLTDDQRLALQAQLTTLQKNRTEESAKVKEISSVEEFINSLLEHRSNLLEDEIKKAQLITDQRINQLNIEKQALELSSRSAQAKLGAITSKAAAPGQFALPDVSAVRAAENSALQAQISLLHNKYELERLSIQNAIIETEMRLKAAGVQKEAIDAQTAALKLQLEVLDELEGIETDTAKWDSATKSANDYKNTLQNLTSVLTDKVFTDLAANLQRAADSTDKSFSNMAAAGQLFRDIGAAAIADAFAAMGESLIKFLETGEMFANGFLGFLGSMLISLGEALIQMGIAALAVGLIRFLFGDVTGPAIGTAAAVVATAAGAGLILLGSAMGGSGKYSPANSASASTANSANAATGASGLPTYDPAKDPKTMFQKSLMPQVIIDIRHDDGIIVKKVIKAVNQNGRLANLIGNRNLGFGY